MKILPKKQDIDRAKAIEKKIEIDAGLSLARSVDKLREVRATEEKNLMDYRATAFKQVQYEIAQFIEERDNLERENNEARDTRNKLLEPLNKEWAEVNKVKAQTERLKTDAELLKQSSIIKLGEIEKEKDKITKIVETIKLKQNETEKANLSAIGLKELAQKEYEIARDEHEKQTATIEKRLLELNQKERDQDERFSIRENEIKQKESEIIIKEEKLNSQEVRIQNAMKEINKYAPRT